MRFMHYAWLVLAMQAFAVTEAGRGQQSPSGIVIRDFSITDSPCGYRHDISVEKVLEPVRVVADAAKRSRGGSIATIELRNNSEKTVTAYVLNYTFTDGGKTDYYDGHGEDLLYEMALLKGSRKKARPNSTLLPGEILKQEIRGGGEHGKFEVFPCMVAFEDATSVGPPTLLTFVMQMRAEIAKEIGALIADLKLAQDSANPTLVLTNRAKQIERTNVGRMGEEPYRYLEVVAAELSTDSTALNRRVIDDHISALHAQQEVLIKQSTVGEVKYPPR
jgi:hypothetical protein